eukprot:10983239-Heterocapsa_arctica.AAC.1
MQVLNSVIVKLQAMTDVELAFEWPRGATGWKEPAMDAIIRSMPIEFRFDGCVYNVGDEHQTLLHK